MSSRALRKAQREKEEAQARLQSQDAEDTSEEEVVQPKKPQKSAFAMLEDLDQNDDDDDNDENDDPAHVDHGGVAVRDVPGQQTQHSAQSRKKKKNSKKKAKSKATTKPGATQTASDRADDVDDIDAALRELAMTRSGSTTAQTAADTDPVFDEACQLLAIDRNHLHAQNEMRKLFGRAAVEQDDDHEAQAAEGQAGGNRRQQRRGQQAGLAQALRGQRGQGRAPGAASLSLRRNLFIQGKEEWPVATSGGLGMEIVSKASNGTIEYRYVHNRMYQDVQAQFEACVASMDPNRLVILLQHNPYHISTLLQVSEIAKSERDHTTSGDLLERALFSMGRAIHSTFAKTLSEGKARLDFRRPENREFWLASWRYMLNLSMRGTWRTVYEWARLLLSLSPEEDPYALWLALDQYALRSKQDLDYINLSRNSLFKHVHEGMPNVQLSQGLAEYRSGNKTKGQQTLFSAISRYPWFAARLFRELDLDAPPAIWGQEARTEKERLYAELYAVRAKDVWNTPENTSLLIETASAIPTGAKTAAVDEDEITLDEARHTILSDTPALIAMLPKQLSSQYTSVSDPLPPPDSIHSYVSTKTETRRAGTVDDLREYQQLRSFFTTLLPRLMRRGVAEGEEEVEAAPDEAAQRIMAERNITEADIMQRLDRLRELGERNYDPVLEAADDAFDAQSEDEDDSDPRERGPRARVVYGSDTS